MAPSFIEPITFEDEGHLAPVKPPTIPSFTHPTAVEDEGSLESLKSLTVPSSAHLTAVEDEGHLEPLKPLAALPNVATSDDNGQTVLEMVPPKNGQDHPAVKEVMSGATKLRRILENTNELVVCPGVYDGFSARIAISVGFDCLYMVNGTLNFLMLYDRVHY